MDHVIPSTRVLAERPKSHTAMRQFMHCRPGLGHQPDLVLLDWDGPGRHLLIDIKTLDVSGPTHVSDHHTDTRRLAAHEAIERSAPAAYRDPVTGQALPPGCRLLVFTVSISGAIGAPGRTFLAEVSRRLGRSLPVTLLDDATWATPHFGPFARMALTFAARRSLALALRSTWGTAEQAAAARPPTPPPSPAPD